MADTSNSADRAFPQPHHLAWLSVHPHRSLDWLKRMTLDGFHVHHVDGDHGNNEPMNLLLIDGVDHLRLHGMKLRDGLKRWRGRKRPKPPSVYPGPVVLVEADIAALLSRL